MSKRPHEIGPPAIEVHSHESFGGLHDLRKDSCAPNPSIAESGTGLTMPVWLWTDGFICFELAFPDFSVAVKSANANASD